MLFLEPSIQVGIEIKTQKIREIKVRYLNGCWAILSQAIYCTVRGF